jgi:hypothetical protein
MSGEPSREQHARERRARRAAGRQGIVLIKSRLKDRRALGYGLWSVDDPRRGVHRDGLSLDQVEAYLDHGPD